MSEMRDPYEDQLSAARFRAELDVLRQAVQSVCEDMYLHILGTGCVDDSPVACWCRDLTLALNGRSELSISSSKLFKKLGGDMFSEQMEKLKDDAEGIWPRTDKSIEDDITASIWVREHGGVEIVKEQCKFSDDAASWIRKLCKYEDDEVVNIDAAMYAIERRLMPPGMEWPRFEDNGEMVTDENCPDDAMGVFFALDGSCWAPMYNIPDNAVGMCDRVKRPNPDPIGADGLPIHEGDHGYWMDQPGVEIVVTHVDPNECAQLTVSDVHGRGNIISADEFTHAKPVIGADWLPIKRGETVYGIGRSRHEFIVLEPHDINLDAGKRFSVKCFDVDDNEVYWCDPKLLSHAKHGPTDSRKRTKKDAGEGMRCKDGD